MTIQTETRAPMILALWNFDHGLMWLALFLLLLHTLPPATAQVPNILPPPPPDPFSRLRFDRNMAIIMVVLVVIFFILGFLSVYTRQCAERRIRGRLDLTISLGMSGRRSRGLEREIIDTFPTFVYSTVKGLKIGRSTLECAVCLNEFQDDETLRLIPKCSHVFHPDCIDIWLASHSTCPVCRANLIPKPGDTSFVAIQIPNPGVEFHEPDQRSDSQVQQEGETTGVDDNRNLEAAASPNLSRSQTTNHNRPPRSRSTGFRIASLFTRSHSTGHSLQVQAGENWERFTLILPEDAQKQLLNRTKSCVTLRRERSERRGYRTRSVGSGRGRSYGQYEQWGFTMRPPFLSRTGRTVDGSGVAMDNVGEGCSDPLRPESKH